MTTTRFHKRNLKRSIHLQPHLFNMLAYKQLLITIYVSALSVSGFVPFHFPTNLLVSSKSCTNIGSPLFSQPEESDGTTAATPGPVLNGKRVLPYKILMAGLKGSTNISGVYAILNKEFKRGSEGWENCRHIGVSKDLENTLKEHFESHDQEEGQVAHVRALTFVIPNKGAMEDVANQWRALATEAGGRVNFDPILAAIEETIPYADDEDDEDYDDWDEDDDEIFEEMKMTAEAMSVAREAVPESASTPVGEIVAEEQVSSSSAEQDVVSPFDASTQTEEDTTEISEEAASSLKFTKENVDKAVEEVRPYLIADGGNVSVDIVEEENKNVYLKLEGACGSCPSSTVTMKMGIERVLKENFADLGEVIQVEDGDGEEKATELTWQAVENEVNRIKPAIIAMGGVVRIINVDPIGVVELEFRGANKVRQGLELAILDIDFVNHVKFTMGE